MNIKHWNAIAKMVANAADSLPVEDIGRKRIDGIVVHEFMIGDQTFHIHEDPVDDWELYDD